MNILITGANRGIGLKFAHYYLERGDTVWACYRANPDTLAGIDSQRLRLVQWDVADDQPPTGALPERLDLLINNAGIYGPAKDAQTLDDVTPEAMLNVFNVDCVGPLRVVKYLKSRLIAADGVIANISSKMGSSSDNSSGGSYAYRAAKAALVIVSKSMAVDLAAAGIQVITLHPGWVQTDMTAHNGLIDAASSVSGMALVIEHARDYEPGAFIAYDGSVVAY